MQIEEALPYSKGERWWKSISIAVKCNTHMFCGRLSRDESFVLTNIYRRWINQWQSLDLLIRHHVTFLNFRQIWRFDEFFRRKSFPFKEEFKKYLFIWAYFWQLVNSHVMICFTRLHCLVCLLHLRVHIPEATHYFWCPCIKRYWFQNIAFQLKSHQLHYLQNIRGSHKPLASCYRRGRW